ncbi:MAG TPA: VOC family protein [Streptosporangiaceae bacterium]|nr:VOC family protein [Streptosporangiaceae bacterium]
MAVNVQELRTVVVHVADVSRAAAFYERALGLPRVYEHGGRVAVQLGQARLLLHPAELDSTDITTARHGRTELYLGVPDVDAALDELRDKGVPVLQEATDEPWGERDAAVLDPDGYPVFLTQSRSGDWTSQK